MRRAQKLAIIVKKEDFFCVSLQGILKNIMPPSLKVWETLDSLPTNIYQHLPVCRCFAPEPYGVGNT